MRNNKYIKSVEMNQRNVIKIIRNSLKTICLQIYSIDLRVLDWWPVTV